MADLKPCPFCGSDFLRVSDFEEYVACEDCGTLGQSGRNEAEAIAAWNRRATPPEVTALVAAATDLRDQIARWHDGAPPAGPDESKALFEALDVALKNMEAAQ